MAFLQFSCSFQSITETACSYDRLDKRRSLEIISLRNCSKNITDHCSYWSFSGVNTEREPLLARVGVFKEKETSATLQHGNWTPFAHITGVKCCVPQILSKHGINRKADRGISKVVSKRIVNTTGKFVPVGRSNNCSLLVWKKIAPAIVRGNTAFIHN